MEQKIKKKGFLNMVERVGNKLPHPATIFVILCGIIVLLSALLANMGVSVLQIILAYFK